MSIFNKFHNSSLSIIGTFLSMNANESWLCESQHRSLAPKIKTLRGKLPAELRVLNSPHLKRDSLPFKMVSFPSRYELMLPRYRPQNKCNFSPIYLILSLAPSYTHLSLSRIVTDLFQAMHLCAGQWQSLSHCLYFFPCSKRGRVTRKRIRSRQGWRNEWNSIPRGF